MKITNNLYILNKYSKKIRDARTWLKEYLFEFSNCNNYENSNLIKNSDKFINLINELSQFYDFEYEVTKEKMFPKINGNIISYNTITEWQYMIENILYVSKNYGYKNKIDFLEIKVEFFNENNEWSYHYIYCGEEIYNYFFQNNYKYHEIKEIYEKMNIFEKNYSEFINFLHDLLHQLDVIKNNFYEFKDKMLSLNCDKPIGYHKIGNDESYFLLFKLENNTFHLPTRMEEEEIILKNVKKLNDIDDIISAEITKETDVSLCDAIKIMKDFEDVSPNEVFYENWQIGFAS